MISHEEYNLRRHQHLTTSTPLLADQKADYPGVFIDYVRKDGATAILACVEYDPNKEALQTVVYGNCASDEPTEIVEHYNTVFEE